MADAPVVVLASASPRRRELLHQIGVPFRQDVVAIDESPRPGEAPRAHVLRLARAKAEAVVAAGRAGGLPVLGADTVVVIDGEILGKPSDADQARAMLRRLSGRAHEVLTAVAVSDGRRRAEAVSVSRVYFRDLTEAEITAYWATGEPADKAGAYAIQGRGAVFVRRLEGSHSGVVGLPLYETARLLEAFGIRVLGEELGAGR
ncbi:MAG: septum formation inhibitor Maf [Gammaproteobacteria bacterium]|nr:MAG: septum formation inhibitor Maf [Gammaproteobacteria bacterium]